VTLDVWWLPEPPSSMAGLMLAQFAAATSMLGRSAGQAAAAVDEMRLSLLRFGLSDRQTQAELDDFWAYHRTTAKSLEQDWHEWLAMRRASEQLAPQEGVTPFELRRVLLTVAETIGVPRRYSGHGDCRCNSTPHPAGRDYRRRTKHRNRRRHR